MNNHSSKSNHDVRDIDVPKIDNSEELLDGYDEQNDDKKKTIFIGLFKASSMVILALALLVFAGTAWFTMNKNVETNGMGVQVSVTPFELKTVGYYGYYDDWLSSGTGKIAESREEAPKPPSGTIETISTEYNATIQWLITAEDNAKNYVTDNTDEDEVGIRPGSSGSLKFSVVPRERETINIRFKLDVIPYRTVYQTDGSGTVIIDDDNRPIELAPEIITEPDEAVTYLNNHVLFFKNRTGTVGNYVYSDLIPLNEAFELVFVPYAGGGGTYSDSLTFDKNNGELQEKEFTIYWVWPETFAEFALRANQQTGGSRPVCGDDNLETFNKLKLNPGNHLDGYNRATDTDNTPDESLTQDILKTHYSKLSLEYNNADQKIGDNIGYFVLQLTATNE